MSNKITGAFDDLRGEDASSFGTGQTRYLQPFTATAFRKDAEVKEDFAVVQAYMADKVLDPASLDLKSGDADVLETFRDSESRFENMLAKALALQDAPEEVKASYRRIQSKFENIDKEGVGEWAGAIKDYGIDAITDPFNIGAVWFAATTGGVGAPASIAAKQVAKAGAKKALTKALAGPAAVPKLPSKALSTTLRETPDAASVLNKLRTMMDKNPKKSLMAVGATQGAIDDMARQNLSMTVGSQEDYSSLQTIITAGVSGGANVALSAGVGALTRKFKADSNMDELTPERGAELFDEGIEGEWIPSSGATVLSDLDRLISGPTGNFKDITPDEELIKKYAADLGGGANTVEEVREIIMAAAQTETTAGAIKAKWKKDLYAHATHNTSRWLGKASGVLSAAARTSPTAKLLQEKFANQSGLQWKVNERLVGKDFFETQREIQGRFFEDYRAIIEPLATSKFLRRNKDNAKLAEEINDALMLAVRGQKAQTKNNGLDAATNTAINKASVGVKNLYKKMGAELKEADLIEQEVSDYIPRSWNRKAIMENQEGLAKLFEDQDIVPKGSGEQAVKDMLKIGNQLDGGGSGGFFFSSKRAFDNIKKDADFQEFLDTDVRATMNLYSFQAAKGLAKVRVLGVRNETEFKDFYIDQIRKEMLEAGETFTNQDAERITRVYRTTTSENLNRFGKYAQGAVDGYGLLNRVAYLGLATVSSLTEVFLNFSKAGFKNSFKGLAEAMEVSYKGATGDTKSILMSRHGMTAGEAQAEMRKFSLGMDMGLSQLENRLGGDDLQTKWMQKTSDGFFKMTLLEDWTKFVQTSSYMSGKNLIEDNIKALVAHGSKPLGKRQQTLINELAELDIDYKKGMDWYKKGAKTNDEFYDKTVLSGAARYANSVILQPTGMSNAKPYLFSNPKTSIAFQLMGYPAAFTNTVLKGSVRQLTKDVRSGDPRNVAKVGVTALTMVQVARIMNDWRSDGKSEEEGTTQAYLKGIQRVGGLGILADNVNKGYNAAKYSNSIMGYPTALFGPLGTDVLGATQRGIVPTIAKKIPSAASPIQKIIGLADEDAAEIFKNDMDDFIYNLTREYKDTEKSLIPSFESSGGRLAFATGGEVTDVPNVPTEPDERIDKLTGLPYNEQAGDAYTDIEDRQKFSMGGRAIAKKILSSISDEVPQTSRVDSDLKSLAERKPLVDPDGAIQYGIEDSLLDLTAQAPVVKKQNSLEGAMEANRSSQTTQRANTVGTATKASEYLDSLGVEGRSLDYGAGKGLNAQANKIDDTFEPFPEQNFNPTFVSPNSVPKNTYGKIISTNVINVLPPELRQQAVTNIGDALKVGGKALIQTWDAAAAKAGMASKKATVVEAEPLAFTTSTGSYQKGFTKGELQEYIQDLLGDNFNVDIVPPKKKISGVAVVVTKIIADSTRLQKADGGYIVQSGDTLSKIARENATTVKELASLNKIEDVNKIYANDVLRLAPTPEPKSTSSDMFDAVSKASSATATAILKSLKRQPTVKEVQTVAKIANKIDSEAGTEGVKAGDLQEYKDLAIRNALSAQSAIKENLESVQAQVSESSGAFMQSVRSYLDSKAEETGAATTRISTEAGSAISEGFEAVKQGTGSTLKALRKALSVDVMGDMTMDQVREANAPKAPDLSEATLPELRDLDFSASGRTAENMTGATAEPRETSLMGDMTTEQVREANAPKAPDLSDVKLPALDFSSKGRTAENTMGTNSSPDLEGTKEFFSKLSDVKFSSKGRTAENTEGTTGTPEPTSIMGDMTMEQVREANAPKAPDLSEVSKKRKPSRIVPTMIRQLIYDVSGGEETLTENDLMDSELQSLIKIALEKEERGSSKIEYEDYKTQSAGQSQYADVGGGGGVVDFFKKLNSPAYSMKTTLGQAQLFKNDKGETIVSDRYNFNNSDGTFKLLRFLSGAKNAGLSFYGQARNIGREFGSPEGDGSHVLINLGVLDSKDMDNLVAAL